MPFALKICHLPENIAICLILGLVISSYCIRTLPRGVVFNMLMRSRILILHCKSVHLDHTQTVIVWPPKIQPFPGVGQPSQWELLGVVSLARGSLSSHGATAPIAPTSAPAPCFCPRRQPYVTTGKPSATLPCPGPPPSPSCPFLPAPTLSCCRSSEVTFLTRFCPKSLHLGKNSPSGACFDRRVKYCLF